jgi:hypothetical protein
MSTVERWDVVLRFVDGPLSVHGDAVLRGPVVRMGANPGPGGLRLDGYRGLDDRQAVITAYDGGTVSIAPVGKNQVRVAPHENQTWADLQPIRGPVHLAPGDAFHLGPPGRGCTALFVQARRLGVWEQNRILSEAAQADPSVRPSDVKALDAQGGRPWWFIPALLLMGLFTAAGVLLSVVVGVWRKVEPLGPVAEGSVFYERVDLASVEVDPSQLEGLNQAFDDFIMKPNAAQAGWKQLESNPKLWDQTMFRYIGASVAAHARAKAFWKRLDEVKDDYAYVVEELRKARLPEAFAAIPYRESQYKAEALSVVCAKGYWQFMPEVGHRAGMTVKDCSMKGTNVLYTPTRMSPVIGVIKNAEYVAPGPKCKITSCRIDERTDLEASTRGAIKELKDNWEDPLLAASGANVQITILSHNAGYDNSRFEEKKVNRINMLPSYQAYLKESGQEKAPDFYGKNITCTGEEYGDIVTKANERCGGHIANQSQHYAYTILAQHILAVCFYAQNYGNAAPFDAWRPYVRGDGYCKDFQIPDKDIMSRWGGK